MKDYFIGQGTSIVAQFDTLFEMLAYHKTMPALDRHFCKLYDGIKYKIADGYDIVWSKNNASTDPWRKWK